MAVIYRKDKNSPLTIEEMDGNFQCLEDRLKKLENAVILGEGVDRIEQNGDEVSIITQFGRILGKFVLPKCYPIIKGEWLGNTNYAIHNWVYCKGEIYACTKAHQSKKNFSDDKD